MKKERGMFLLTSYLVLTVISTFALTLFLKSVSATRSAERAINRIIAFHLAESGVDQAIVTLRSNPSYTGQGYTSVAYAGGFDTQAAKPDQSDPDLYRITGTGYAPDNSNTSYAYQMRQVVAYIDSANQSPFDFGIFSNTSIQMSGNAGTDSYDSRNGPYNAGTAGTNGDVGTNTTRAGFVMLSGNVRIKGDAIVGPGGNPASVITMSGNSVIEGTRAAASTAKVLTPVSIPSGVTNLGSLTVNGNNTVTSAGGTYWYSSINISGNGRVNFTGPTTIYVSGNVSISGNGFGTSQNLPPNLQIHVQGLRTVSVSGNGNFYGGIYAPNSGISVTGNGEIYGGLVGNTFADSGNGKVHYDEALGSAGSGSTGSSRVIAWTEV
ncbi:MAG: hypothetical protein HY447_00830 [Candidatus Omnitrophica bacterium]|nr:hypothetical protein [Candidatus Omnitrophota bacterium]